MAAKAEQTAAKAAVKQERAEAALKINLTEQASQRSASFKQRLEAMESAGDELREEVAELAAETEDTVDAANAEDNLAILELAEMLQSLMKAAQSHQ